MALADYFSKNLLAISQVLKNGSSAQFQNALDNTIVGILFDEAAKRAEGKAALDLVTRLICRLYPKIKIIDVTNQNHELLNDLKKIATAINSKIEIVDDPPTVVIVIGDHPINRTITQGPVYYIGSNEWIVNFSPERPVAIGNSPNPFGAGVAACIGASNTFRYVFSSFLTNSEFDEEFSLSLITLKIGTENPETKSETVELGNLNLVGFGAIGNGVIWALANASFISGTLSIIEPEDIDITNLQRYVLAEERHINKPKIEIAKEYIKSDLIKLKLINDTWCNYLNEGDNWANESVLVAIDNAKDRIGIQASLPDKIINSYTESNLIGISRHYNFAYDTCLVCTYIPHEERKSYSQEVADNLNLPQLEQHIRNYIFYNKEADEQLLRWVADANGIECSELQKFIGVPVPEFYAKVVCGGILIELRNGEGIVENIEAPLAFQSAMAGILELSELVINKGGLRNQKFTTQTHFYPLNPIKDDINPYNHSFLKDKTGRCICSDKDFVDAYKLKWDMDDILDDLHREIVE